MEICGNWQKLKWKQSTKVHIDRFRMTMTISLAWFTQNACSQYLSLSLSNYSFGPTRTPSPWEGIRKSDKFSAVCPQRLPDVINEQEALKKMPKGRLEYIKRLLPFLQNQSEDCLYLNVFSPLHGKPEAIFYFNFNNFFPSYAYFISSSTSTHSLTHPVAAVQEKKLPVLVFIHGESFEWNSGNPYDGSVLASYADMIVVTLNYRLGILGIIFYSPFSILHMSIKIVFNNLK